MCRGVLWWLLRAVGTAAGLPHGTKETASRPSMCGREYGFSLLESRSKSVLRGRMWNEGIPSPGI